MMETHTTTRFFFGGNTAPKESDASIISKSNSSTTMMSSLLKRCSSPLKKFNKPFISSSVSKASSLKKNGNSSTNKKTNKKRTNKKLSVRFDDSLDQVYEQERVPDELKQDVFYSRLELTKLKRTQKALATQAMNTPDDNSQQVLDFIKKLHSSDDDEDDDDDDCFRLLGSVVLSTLSEINIRGLEPLILTTEIVEHRNWCLRTLMAVQANFGSCKSTSRKLNMYHGRFYQDSDYDFECLTRNFPELSASSTSSPEKKVAALELVMCELSCQMSSASRRFAREIALFDVYEAQTDDDDDFHPTKTLSYYSDDDTSTTVSNDSNDFLMM